MEPKTMRNKILVGATMREGDAQVRETPNMQDSGYGSMIASKLSSMGMTCSYHWDMISN